MKTKYWLIPLLLVGAAVLVLRPVPIPEEEADCLTAIGSVVKIYEAGVKDVVFKLEGQNRMFYVNRGLERGLNLEELRAELTGREITIKYPKYWTPLDPFNSSKHISKLEVEGTTIFSEID